MTGGGGKTIKGGMATVMLGPREQGRAYGILRQSDADSLRGPAAAMLMDFCMSVAAWADGRHPDFVAMFPLDSAGTHAVARVAYLGDEELGSVAVANVVIATPQTMRDLGWQAHRLLDAIPRPDGLAFGAAPLAVDLHALARAPVGTVIPSFGLEWRDQDIAAPDAERETVLKAALDGVNPAAQRVRLNGWSTTAALRKTGGFDPREAFRLIVAEPKSRREAGDRRQAVFSGGRVEPDPDVAPASWLAWNIVDARSRGRSPKGLAWSPDYAELPVERATAIAILEAASSLKAVERVELLCAVALAASETPALKAGLLEGVAQALERVMAGAGGAESAAFYLDQYVAGCAATPDRLPPILYLACADGILGWLDESRLALLIDAGLFDNLGDDDFPAERLERVPAETLAYLLDRAMEGLRRRTAPRRAAAVLLDRCARSSAPTRAVAAKALAELTEMPISVDDDLLATEAVFGLVSAQGAEARKIFSARFLRRPWRSGAIRTPAARGAMAAAARILNKEGSSDAL